MTYCKLSVPGSCSTWETAVHKIKLLYGTCVFTRAVTGKNKGLPRTNPFSKDFQGREFRKKFKDFQGLSRIRGNLVDKGEDLELDVLPHWCSHCRVCNHCDNNIYVYNNMRFSTVVMTMMVNKLPSRVAVLFRCATADVSLIQ